MPGIVAQIVNSSGNGLGWLFRISRTLISYVERLFGLLGVVDGASAQERRRTLFRQANPLTQGLHPGIATKK